MKVSQLKSWFAFILCGLNLFVMHFNILQVSYLEVAADITFIIDNLLGIFLDIFILFNVLKFLFKKNVAIFICFFTTWVWSFSNVIYSRFFNHYISLSAISQIKTIFDSFMLETIYLKLEYYDIYYFFVLILFLILIKYYSLKTPPNMSLIQLFFILVILDIGTHFVYCAFNPQLRYTSYFCHRLYTHHFDKHRNYSQPNFANYVRGSFHTLCVELFNIQDHFVLTQDKLYKIENFINNDKTKTDLPLDLSKYNLIFILAESYMSFTSDYYVKDKEVTPFLNTLKRESNVFYNGKMKENITIGESSDGQFIYMVGLLPLRSVITISKAKEITLMGLPTLLKRKSRMIIPTISSMWNQDKMCEQYGFDYLFTSKDIVGNSNDYLNDEQVFQLAMQKDKKSHQPFFSTILTMSMHQPYTRQNDSTFLINDKTIPHDLACYLNACHYTDRQIKKYFEHLKQIGIYDNSIIVIASDHAVHNTDFGGVNKDIPLYIVNIPHEAKDRMWKGECNQLDVFTTLLDLLGVESNWYGLGYSLLSPNYQNTIDSKKWDISEWIIRGDYFSTIEH